MKTQRGVTLVELIIGLVIAGILVAIGVPNLAVFLKNSTRTTHVNDLVTALNYARSEAIKRNTEVRVCASTDATTCSGGSDFSAGWVVRQVAPADVLRVFDQDLGGNTTIIGTVGDITYIGSGFLSVATGATFTYCDDRGARESRAVLVSNTGRPSISRDVDADGIHETAAGADLSCS